MSEHPVENPSNWTGGNNAIAVAVYAHLIQETQRQQQHQQMQQQHQQQQIPLPEASKDAYALLQALGLSPLLRQQGQQMLDPAHPIPSLGYSGIFAAPVREQASVAAQGQAPSSAHEGTAVSTTASVPIATATAPQQFAMAGNAAGASSSLHTVNRLAGDVTTKQARAVSNPSDAVADSSSVASTGTGGATIEADDDVDNDDTSSRSSEEVTLHPCPARGMPADHNSITAYFVVTNRTYHGQHLHCCHPSCDAAGVKFRYCKVCNKPVTKQNFKSRHWHADILTGKAADFKCARRTAGADGGGRPKKESDIAALSPSEPSARTEGAKAEGLDSVSDHRHRNSKSNRLKRKVVPLPMGQLQSDAGRTRSIVPAVEPVQNGSADSATAKRTKRKGRRHGVYESRKQMSQWSALFKNRPNDIRRIGWWIQDVVDASERYVLDRTASVDGKRERALPQLQDEELEVFDDNASIGLCWFRLLRDRPGSDDGPAMNQWLVDVLKTSFVRSDPSDSDTSSTTRSTDR